MITGPAIAAVRQRLAVAAAGLAITITALIALSFGEFPHG